MDPRLSRRTRWDLRPNRLAAALAARKRRGDPVLDLTESNPTRCGLSAEGGRILAALARPAALGYDPDPKGSPEARRAVAALYAARGAPASADRIVLTASTSEGYSHLFRILADPGEEVLVPRPSYPLFDLLARVNDVALRPYLLVEEEGFRIDVGSVEEAVSERTRAVVVVSPGNPSGSFLKREEREALVGVCLTRGCALIADEVFSDYASSEDPSRVATLAGEDRVPTFVLDGISKMLALPQMKLGWIAASGPAGVRDEALARLEVVADTYLSVNTPVQQALGDLMALRITVQAPVRARLAANRGLLDEALRPPHPARALPCEGGWSAVLRVPATRSDEEWALALLEEDGVLVHPGFFFDFTTEGRLVVSLLPEEDVFREGVRRLAARVAAG
jgi:aspartate/methionine/tyrosine aminotransferase